MIWCYDTENDFVELFFAIEASTDEILLLILYSWDSKSVFQLIGSIILQSRGNFLGLYKYFCLIMLRMVFSYHNWLISKIFASLDNCTARWYVMNKQSSGTQKLGTSPVSKGSYLAFLSLLKNSHRSLLPDILAVLHQLKKTYPMIFCITSLVQSLHNTLISS